MQDTKGGTSRLQATSGPQKVNYVEQDGNCMLDVAGGPLESASYKKVTNESRASFTAMRMSRAII